MSDWTLRLARPEDADHWPAIERAAAEMFRSDPDLVGMDFDETWETDELRGLIRKGHCLAAQLGERPIGFLASQPFSRELHVWEMSVHPDGQRKGIGAGLVRACLIDAANSGFKAVTLTTFRDVPWNGPFYARLGFEEVTALDAHARLASELALEADNGLPAERRCAMIKFLD
ncbi:GNAT family N-acetyltransferase [Parerythrobacter aestuarii]|uniref:GNAT family N-acetyltransferase n=1 Tax=Parerythrobacter aestuarii TaxID=3020909 RepID=UPI0024DE9723|nr:GNAT family N-acetyltransferase [Parerythrobacter aestuarii]